MSEAVVSLIVWLGPDLAAEVFSVALAVGFGFLVYGGTTAVLWGCEVAYRASRCLRREHHNLPHEDRQTAAGGGETGLKGRA